MCVRRKNEPGLIWPAVWRPCTEVGEMDWLGGEVGGLSQPLRRASSSSVARSLLV